MNTGNVTRRRLWAISLSMIVPAAIAGAQIQKKAPSARTFDVISIKYSGTVEDHIRHTANDIIMLNKPVEYKGNRLSCDTYLDAIIKFAFFSQVVPYRDEMPRELRQHYYQIDAIAPNGTPLEATRGMLAKALIERLGLRYHVAEREVPVFFLVRGARRPELLPSTEPVAPGPTLHDQWRLNTRAGSLADLARFLSGGMRREVLDKTGIPGNYQFHLDWSAEVQKEGADVTTDLAIADAHRLGLKLESGKEARKFLVVDHANEKATPN